MSEARDHRRPEVYPILPDWELEADNISPHPDGRPWRKACEGCAFRTNDPEHMGKDGQADIRQGTPGTLFYCAHRHETGYHRICACFAACRAGRPTQNLGTDASAGMGGDHG